MLDHHAHPPSWPDSSLVLVHVLRNIHSYLLSECTITSGAMYNWVQTAHGSITYKALICCFRIHFPKKQKNENILHLEFSQGGVLWNLFWKMVSSSFSVHLSHLFLKSCIALWSNGIGLFTGLLGSGREKKPAQSSSGYISLSVARWLEITSLLLSQKSTLGSHPARSDTALKITFFFFPPCCSGKGHQQLGSNLNYQNDWTCLL